MTLSHLSYKMSPWPETLDKLANSVLVQGRAWPGPGGKIADVLHLHSVVLLMSRRSWLGSQRIDSRIC
ncbi:hypothetical protein DY000_02039010 [Brassica cretica]|uniref:Uncharacterized protein n=1 Tax=Brassica cretica TaxID=69181 RepID=A0ABQ7BAQ6_BRACR|nr:hypothetical protein DY000_02039010 [Brassica cretica]